MAIIREYFTNPAVFSGLELILEHHLSLYASTFEKEEIILQLMDDDFLMKRIRNSIKNIAGYKLKESEIERLAYIFSFPDYDVLKMDDVTELLTDSECINIESLIRNIGEGEVIVDFLTRPFLTDKQKELLRKYCSIMQDNPHLKDIEKNVCEILTAKLCEQVNTFSKEIFCVSVSLSSSAELEGAVDIACGASY